MGGRARLWWLASCSRPMRCATAARDRGGAAGEIALEVRVGEAHLGLVGLAEPQPGARRLVDDRRRNPQLAGELPHRALEQAPDGQQVDAAVPVLREIPDRQLAPVAGARDEVIERVRDEIQAGHPHPWFDVRQRQPGPDVHLVGRRDRKLAARQRLDRLPQIAHEPVVGRRQVEADRGDPEMVRRQPRVRLVIGVAVTGHHDPDHMTGGRADGEPGHHGRVDPAAEPDDDAPGAGSLDLCRHPSRECCRTVLHPCIFRQSSGLTKAAWATPGTPTDYNRGSFS